jgi:hypothetical protein
LKEDQKRRRCEVEETRKERKKKSVGEGRKYKIEEKKNNED